MNWEQSCLAWEAELPGRGQMKRPQSKEQPLIEYQGEVTGPLDVHSFIWTQPVQFCMRHILGQKCLQAPVPEERTHTVH